MLQFSRIYLRIHGFELGSIKPKWLGVLHQKELVKRFFVCLFCFFKTSWKDMLIDFRETGRQGEKDGEKHRCER